MAGVHEPSTARRTRSVTDDIRVSHAQQRPTTGRCPGTGEGDLLLGGTNLTDTDCDGVALQLNTRPSKTLEWQARTALNKRLVATTG